MTAVCAFRPAGIDVNRTLKTASADAAVGRIPIVRESRETYSPFLELSDAIPIKRATTVFGGVVTLTDQGARGSDFGCTNELRR